MSRARPAPSFVIAAAAGALVIVTSMLDFAADGGHVRIFESTELAGWMLVVPGLWRLHRGRQAAAHERSWVS